MHVILISIKCVQTNVLLLSLSSLITRDIFIIKTSYYYRTKLLVHKTQWCKNMNFEKCTGFRNSGHIYVRKQHLSTDLLAC